MPDKFARRFAALRHHWFMGLLLASLLVHVVMLMVLQPWGQTHLTFDPAQEQQRTQLVMQREEIRRAAEHARRQALPLPEEHARQVKEREETKHRSALEDNVQRLAVAREEALRKRERALERLKARTERELVPHELERLADELRQLESGAHEVTREPRFEEEAKTLKAAVQEQLKAVDEMVRTGQAEPDKPLAVVEKAREVRELAEELAKRYEEMAENTGGSEKGRTTRAANAARDTAEVAAELQQGIDLARFNDTSEVAAIDAPPVAAGSDLSGQTPAELYDSAVALEQQLSTADTQARAAELALLQGTSIEESLAHTAGDAPSRPQLHDDLASGESSEKSGKGSDAGSSGASENSEASGTSGGSSVGEINSFREAIRTAVSETSDMARRAERVTGTGRSPTAASRVAQMSPQQKARYEQMNELSQTGRKNEVINLVPLQLASAGSNSGNMSAGLIADNSGGGYDMVASDQRHVARLSGRTVNANALPGRMLTDNSARSGFLFVDTWYIVGPWNNWSRSDFAVVHPPEQRIDLDATYTDGKFTNTPSHPDHLLRWKFVQSDRIAIQPPTIHHSATYYAYTEVSSDRTREMLVAVASDDMAKVWLNGTVIWTDVGISGWNLDEGFRRVIFQEGFNTLLVRIENGPTYCAFSVLLCPPEALDATP